MMRISVPAFGPQTQVHIKWGLRKVIRGKGRTEI